MNKKGFTLVEILVVIALIGLLFGIGIPGVMKISNNMKERSFKTKTNLVEQAGILYGNDNKTLLQSDKCTIEGQEIPCKKLSVKELIEDDFLDSEKNSDLVFKDPRNNDDLLNSCVFIYRKNNRIYSIFVHNDTSCQVLSPPKFVHNGVKDGNYYKDKFNLTIENINEPKDNQVIKYNKNNSGETDYNGSQIEIVSKTTIKAKICSTLDTNNCSSEREFSAIMKLGDIKVYTDANKTIEFNSSNWYKSLNLSIESKFAKNIKYRYGSNGEISVDSDKTSINLTENTNGTVLSISSSGEEGQIINKNFTVKIDKTTPVIQLMSNRIEGNKFIQKVKLSDNLSGLNGYKIESNSSKCNNTSNWKSISGTNKEIEIEFTNSGKYYICLKDNANNVKYSAVTIPNILGDVTITSISDNIASGNMHNKNFTITVKSENAEKIEYRIGSSGSYTTCSNSSTCTISINNETSNSILYIKSTLGSQIKENNSYVIKLSKRIYCFGSYSLYPDSLTCTIMNNSNIKKNDTTPVFNGPATEEEGMYKAADDYGNSWYFRGAQSYNYVKFAGFTWRIVRINGDASVRLILEGTLDKVKRDGESTYAGTAHGFNLNNGSNDNAYVGYMYGDRHEFDYDSTHKNLRNTVAKSQIDLFYETYIQNPTKGYLYGRFLSDTMFCGDKTLASRGIGGITNQRGYYNFDTYYAAAERLMFGTGSTIKSEANPTLMCAKGANNTYSRYTVNGNNTSKGIKTNGNLRYPIALLSADELVMAGAWGAGSNHGTNVNRAYYLYDAYKNGVSNIDFITMTPCSGSSASTIYSSYYEISSLYSLYTNYSGGYRPVINLNSSVLVLSGNGTKDNPYLIKDS